MTSRILCVSNSSFFLFNSFLPVMNAMREVGFDVRAIAPVDGWTERLKGANFPFVPLRRFDRKTANPLKDLRLLAELLTIYRRERPDLVLHFTIKANVYGTIAAHLAGARSICTVTGLGWLFTQRTLKTLIGGAGYKFLYRIAFSWADRVVVLNDDDRLFFLRNRLLGEDKCAVIPGQGVDTSRFVPNDFSSRFNGCPVFLLIGRLLWDKGIGEYVEAARIVKAKQPGVEFRLLGPLDTGNRAAIPEHRIRGWEREGLISYLGKTEDVRPFIASCDAVVLPSYREGVPTALLEAMSMQKPVITTDAPGCREVVEDRENGFIVQPKNVPALAGALETFVALSEEEKVRMGRKGRQLAVNRFDERIVTDAYLALVRQALHRRAVNVNEKAL